MFSITAYTSAKRVACIIMIKINNFPAVSIIPAITLFDLVKLQ